MPKVARKSHKSGIDTSYWILKGMGNSYKPKPLRAKLTVRDQPEIEGKPDRVFKLEVMDDAHPPSTPYHTAGKTVYCGPSPDRLRELIDQTFMAPLEFGDRAATRDHLQNKLNVDPS